MFVGWGMYLKKVELESFSKSFSLFFISLCLLFGAYLYLDYKEKGKVLDASILSDMRLCSFDLKCEQFNLDFALADEEKLYTLSKDASGVYSFFPISQSTKNVLKFTYPYKAYHEKELEIRNEMIKQSLMVLLVIIIISALFSFYALHPLRSALRLTEEFIKDILHDFNTPLAALRLNISMLKSEVGENKKILRIEQGIDNILGLQENLRGYLHQHVSQKESFDIKELVQERVLPLESAFSHIRFKIELDTLEIYTNKDAFTRVLDNLLSNAAKYNTDKGEVRIHINKEDKVLMITDTGKGIVSAKKIFGRFYTEQERGLGIGLHIVKKLCDEMKVKIRVESEEGVGSTFFLDISGLTLR